MIKVTTHLGCRYPFLFLFCLGRWIWWAKDQRSASTFDPLPDALCNLTLQAFMKCTTSCRLLRPFSDRDRKQEQEGWQTVEYEIGTLFMFAIVIFTLQLYLFSCRLLLSSAYGTVIVPWYCHYGRVLPFPGKSFEFGLLFGFLWCPTRRAL